MITINPVIGIPRALLYHYYYPGWKTFFNELDYDVKFSQPTNKEIMDNGIKRAVDDLCLPFKIYYGHIKELIGDVNYLLVPRLVSLGKYKCVCPKFMGLPDMVRAAFSDINDFPEIIAPEIDLRNGVFPWRKLAHQLAKRLDVNYFTAEKAFWTAVTKQKKYEKSQKDNKFNKQDSNLKEVDKSRDTEIALDETIKVAVLGHTYIIKDKHLSMNIIKHLRDRSVDVITQDMMEENKLEEASRLQSKQIFWYFNRQIMGAAYHFLENARDKIDGIIQVTSFGCGPDSMIQELVSLKAKNKPDISVLNINLDEHSGQAGLLTRIEAFVDLLERRKKA